MKTYNIIDGNSYDKVDLSGLLKESSYLFYEIKDVLQTKNLNSNFFYNKKISPLFDEATIDANFNKNLLEIIFEETPFYHIESQKEITLDNTILSSTRDVGINDVASPLQTEFWSVLFRDSLGSIQNELLLNIYNKLRYPFIGENQYLNAGLFPELSRKIFSERQENDLGNEIIFRNNVSDNLEDIYSFILEDLKKENINIYNDDEVTNFIKERKGTIYKGCVDTLDDIVNEKINAMYALLNYNPSQSNLLEVWTSSLKNSGKLPEKNILKEKTTYKLQDIKYELLRRKFAGSTTLYKLAIASIGRRGSLIQTTAVGDIFRISSDNMFRDTRTLRIISFPGILTNPIKKNILKELSPYDTFYKKDNSNSNLEENKIPLGILLPLYYTSAPTTANYEIKDNATKDAKGREDYSSEKFFINKNEEMAKEYRSSHLRNISNIINLNEPISPISSSEYNRTFTKLDIFKINANKFPPEKEYNKLDKGLHIEIPGRSPIHKDVNQLDISVPVLTSSSITGSILDISLDSILYHKNSLQKNNENNYNYLTYPLSHDTSLSLMDDIWLNSLDKLTREKSRVQDIITFGAQVSFYANPTLYPGAPFTFFSISFGDDTIPVENGDQINWIPATNYLDLNKNTYSFSEWIQKKGLYPKYAYIWKYEMYYDIESFKVFPGNVRPTLISKITLKLNEMVKKGKLNPYPNFDVENSYMVKEIQRGLDQPRKEKILNVYNTHMGILPFTYPEFKNNTCMLSKLGPYEEIIEDKDGIKNKKYIEYDDIEDLNYQKAIFKFSNFDIITQVPSVKEFAVPPIKPAEPNDHSTSEEILKYNNYIDYEDAWNNFNKMFTEYPTEDTATVYYGIRENKIYQANGDLNDDNNLHQIIKGIRSLEEISSNSEYTYRWSSGIKVLKLTNNIYKLLAGILSKNNNIAYMNDAILKYSPDWKNIQYHLNPYLNFTYKSASPLRKKEVINNIITSNDENGNIKREYTTSIFSENIENKIAKVTLCNLVRDRHLDYLSNDSGEINNIWLEKDKKLYQNSPIGYYLEHISGKNIDVNAQTLQATYSDVFGDNRNSYDYYNDKNSFNKGILSLNRTSPYRDIFTDSFCLKFENSPKNIVAALNQGESSDLITPINRIILNYFKILPMRSTILPEYPLTIENSISNQSDLYTKKYKLEEELSETKKKTRIKTLNKELKNTQLEIEDHDTKIKNYLDTIPENHKNLWKKWSWNKEKYGLTICGNIEIFKQDILNIFKEQLPSATSDDKKGGNTTWHILGRDREFSVDLVNFSEQELSFQLKFTVWLGNDVLNKSDVYILSDKIKLQGDSKEIKFACSYVNLHKEFPENKDISSRNNKLILIINDHIKSTYISSDAFSFPILYYGMTLGSKLSTTSGFALDDSGNLITKDNLTTQINIFRGNLYDLRIFNKGFTELPLLFLQAGSAKELYSYSPSIYKLGYNIYEDLGILKFHKRISPNQEFPEIGSIRIFNRDVWDSILPDRYPISKEEITPAQYSYYPLKNIYYNDTDIYRKNNNTYELYDAVHQNLRNYVEVVNNFDDFTIKGGGDNTDPIILTYNKPIDFNVMNGNSPTGLLEVELNPNDKITMINTLIKPTIYNDVKFFSGTALDYSIEADENKIKLFTANDYSIKIPTSIESNFKYHADLNLNFIETDYLDLASYYNFPTNISVSKDSILNHNIASLINSNESGKGNLILTSFVIPDQENFKYLNESKLDITTIDGYLDKLYAENILINPEVNMLLSARNYYNEVRIPISYISEKNENNEKVTDNISQKKDISSEVPFLDLFVKYLQSKNEDNVSYASRWHAIRNLKEGTYYLSFKYPLQFLPFSEKNWNMGTTVGNTYYGTIRLKIEVKGYAQEYNDEKYKITELNENYKKEKLKNYLESKGSVFASPDNKTFPHRIMHIDMYAMDSFVSTTSSHKNFKENYKWVLIASNHIEDPNVVSLSNEKLANNPKEYNLYIDKKIPVLFANGYSNSFFVSNPLNSNLPIADQKQSIKIRPYNRKKVKDFLSAKQTDDLNNQIMSAGRSYRMLFDYTSNLCEFAYSPNYFTPGSSNLEYNIDEKELKEYNKYYNLLETSNISGNFSYLLPSTSNLYNNYIKDTSNEISSKYKLKGGGYSIIKKDDQIEWDITNSTDKNSTEHIYLGNPYDLSSKFNLLLPTDDSYGFNSNNYLYSFIYNCPEMPELSGGYLNSINCQNKDFTESQLDVMELDELSLINSIYKDIKDNIITSFNNLKKSSSGIFKGLYRLIPNIFYINRQTQKLVPNKYLNKYKIIVSAQSELCTYTTEYLKIRKNENICMKNFSLYENNLIRSFDFNNLNNWNLSYEGNILVEGDAEEYNKISEKASLLTHTFKNGLTYNESSSLGEGLPTYEIFYSKLTPAIIEDVEQAKGWIRTTSLTYKLPNSKILSNDFIISMDLSSVIIRNDININCNNLNILAYLYNNEKLLGTITLSNKYLLNKKESLNNPEYNYYRYYNFGSKENMQIPDEAITHIKYQIIFKNTPQDDLGDPLITDNFKINIVDVNFRTRSTNIFYPNLGLWANNQYAENELIIPPYQSIVFRSVNSDDFNTLVPVRFDNETASINDIGSEENKSSTSIKSITTPKLLGEFAQRNIQNIYDLDLLNKGNTLVSLHQPWIRYLEVAQENKNIKTIIHEYEPLKENGIKKLKIAKSVEPFKDPKITYVKSVDTTNKDEVKIENLSLNVIKDNDGLYLLDDSLFKDSNLRLNILQERNDTAIVSLMNEGISGLIGSFNPDRYFQNKMHSSKVVVTNIQLLEKDTEDVIAELEYLPIIYDEARQHLSLNILFHHRKG